MWGIRTINFPTAALVLVSGACNSATRLLPLPQPGDQNSEDKAAAGDGDAALAFCDPSAGSADAELGGDVAVAGDSLVAGADLDPGPDTVHLVSLSPADGTHEVARRTSITAVFSGPIDAASLGGLKLFLRQSRLEVASSVAYDPAMSTLTLTPNAALGGGWFSISLDVLSARGTPLHAGARFWTRLAPSTAYGRFSGGGLASYNHYTNNGDGVQTRSDAYGSPGLDGIWETADDVHQFIAVTVSDAAGDPQHATTWMAPGLDGLWDTADDVATMYTTYTYGDAGRLASFTSAPGPDGIPGNTDDVDGVYTMYFYDADDRLLGSCYNDAGADHHFLTGDDVTLNCTAWVLGGDGALFRLVTSTGPGGDGQWLTDDDLVPYYTQYNGNRSDSRTPGPDGIVGNTDDVTTTWTVSSTTAGVDSTDTSFAPGPDGQPDTDDDRMTARVVTDLDADNLPLQRRSYGAPGTDGVFGTADDRLDTVFEYRAATPLPH